MRPYEFFTPDEQFVDQTRQLLTNQMEVAIDAGGEAFDLTNNRLELVVPFLGQGALSCAMEGTCNGGALQPLTRLIIKCSTNSGRVTQAEVSGRLPLIPEDTWDLSMRAGDIWTARLQFPSWIVGDKPGAIYPPRMQFGTWFMPREVVQPSVEEVERSRAARPTARQDAELVRTQPAYKPCDKDKPSGAVHKKTVLFMQDRRVEGTIKNRLDAALSRIKMGIDGEVERLRAAENLSD